MGILDPGRQDQLRRLPAPRRRSWPATASSRASSLSAASASRSTPGSWPWRRLDRARRRLRRQRQRPHPALRDRRLHLVHAVAGRHGPPLAAERGPGWRRSAVINGVGRGRDGASSWSSSRSPSSRRAPGSSSSSSRCSWRVMLFIKREYAAEATAWRSGRTSCSRPPPTARVVVAAPALTSGPSSRRSGSAERWRGRRRRPRHVDPAEGEELPRALRAAGAGRPRRHRGVAVPVARPAVRAVPGGVAGGGPRAADVVLLPEHLPRHWWDRSSTTRTSTASGARSWDARTSSWTRPSVAT